MPSVRALRQGAARRILDARYGVQVANTRLGAWTKECLEDARSSSTSGSSATSKLKNARWSIENGWLVPRGSMVSDMAALIDLFGQQAGWDAFFSKLHFESVFMGSEPPHSSWGQARSCLDSSHAQGPNSARMHPAPASPRLVHDRPLVVCPQGGLEKAAFSTVPRPGCSLAPTSLFGGPSPSPVQWSSRDSSEAASPLLGFSLVTPSAVGQQPM